MSEINNSLIIQNLRNDLLFRLQTIRNFNIFPFLILRDLFVTLGMKPLFQNKRFLVKIKGFNFATRLVDFLFLKEVFIDKDYTTVKEFNPHGVVLDLGAGIGDYAVLASEQANLVVSIEKSREEFELLLENAKLNNKSNILSMNIELSKKYTVDFLVSRHLKQKIDLIKMDIEGFEFEALKGSIRTLKTFHPRLVIEFHGTHIRSKILDLTKRYGYKLVKEIKKYDKPHIGMLYIR